MLTHSQNLKRPKTSAALVGSAVILLSIAWIALDSRLLRRQQIEHVLDTRFCPEQLSGYDEFLCQGVDFSSYSALNNQGMPEGYFIFIDSSRYNQVYNISFIYTPASSGKTELRVAAEMQMSNDGLTWEPFGMYLNVTATYLTKGVEFKLKLATGVHTRATYFRVVIREATSSSVELQNVVMHASANTEDFGFVELLFEVVFCLVNLFVAVISISAFLLRTHALIQPMQQLNLAMLAVLPLFISPAFIFTMYYQSTALMLVQYLFRSVFLGVFQCFFLKHAAFNLSTRSVLQRVPALFGLITFASAFCISLVCVSSTHEAFDFYQAKTGLAVVIAVVVFADLVLKVAISIKLSRANVDTTAHFISASSFWFELVLLGLFIRDAACVGNFVQGINAFDLIVSMTVWVVVGLAWESRKQKSVDKK